MLKLILDETRTYVIIHPMREIHEMAEGFLEKASFKAICEIDDNDTNRIITEFFLGGEYDSKGYEVVPYEEWNNDSSHSFKVEKTELDEEDLNNFKQGKWDHWRTGEILDHLCFVGIIPECELIIKVS